MTRTSMNPSRRVLIAVLLAVAASLVAGGLSIGQASAATPGHGSAADELVGPPAPDACGGTQWVGVTGSVPDLDIAVRLIYRAGSPELQSYTIPGLTLPPGSVSIPEIITWDGYIGTIDRRDPASQTQTDEQVRLEFYNGGSLVAATGETEDLIDAVVSAWWVGSLGTVDLPDGADEVRIVHSSLYDGKIDDTNSIVPSAICFEPSTPGEADPAAEIVGTCENVTVTLTNSSEADADAEFSIDLNGEITTHSVAPGASEVVTLPLVDGTTYQLTVSEAGAGELHSSTFEPDCPAPGEPSAIISVDCTGGQADLTNDGGTAQTFVVILDGQEVARQTVEAGGSGSLSFAVADGSHTIEVGLVDGITLASVNVDQDCVVATTTTTTTTVPTEVGGIQQTTTTVAPTTTVATNSSGAAQLAVTGTSSTLILAGMAVTMIAIGLVLHDLRKSLARAR